MRASLVLGVCLAACGGFLVACQTPPQGGQPATISPSVEIVWPPAPNPARIRWEGELQSAADPSVRPGFLRRFWNWVVGKDAPRLVRPHGLAVDPEGRLWVADPGARRVHVFDTAEHEYMELPDDDDPPLSSPIAVVHDPSGVAYVSDSASRVIRRFDREGRDLGEWNGDGEFTRPTGLAFDSGTGLLWVVDTGSHRLLALDEAGHVRYTVGERGEGLGHFNFPTHIAIGPQGRLFVTDTLNFRIQILTNEGESLSAFGSIGDGPGSFSKPKGVAVDRDGNVYVVDGHFGNVQIFEESGAVLLHFGKQGVMEGEFWLPAGIWIAGGDRIYVADAYNHRVQIFGYIDE